MPCEIDYVLCADEAEAGLVAEALGWPGSSCNLVPLGPFVLLVHLCDPIAGDLGQVGRAEQPGQDGGGG